MIGHSYCLNFDKLAKNRSMKIPGKFMDAQRTFFCSELVAKCFKILGIIVNDDIPCSKYFPHHFTALGDDALNLTPETCLGSEI